MATTPKQAKLTDNAVKILNGIRNQASANYKDFVPEATSNEDLKGIGSIIMKYQSLQNEFLSALINRIGLVIVTSKTYDNPVKMFKKGMLEFGETAEEIFVNIAEGFDYDPDDAQNTLFKRYIPDVRSAFHVMNFQKMYPATVSEQQLRQAFLSASGVYDLVSKITETLYTEMNYDEFLVMKYVLARRILDGRTYAKQVDVTNAKDVMKTVKELSNNMTFLSRDYNAAGVYNHATKDEQYFIVNSKYDADLDVDALAYAFNMNKIEFLGHKILIDGFGHLDKTRLNKLLASTPGFTPLTDDECEALDQIPCVLVDKDFFIVYDNLLEFKEAENGKGLYWNYFLHSWKTFSTSPFASVVTFVPDTPAITSVSVSPEELSLVVGQAGQLDVTVETTGYASKAVAFESDSTDIATVDIFGKVTAKATGVATVTITSVYDSTKSTTATITVQ